jgi:hypothetical protein
MFDVRAEHEHMLTEKMPSSSVDMAQRCCCSLTRCCIVPACCGSIQGLVPECWCLALGERGTPNGHLELDIEHWTYYKNALNACAVHDIWSQIAILIVTN